METLISGLSDGAIYGLIAMGMSITFYVTRVINFAHGQLLMVAVMIIAEGSLAHWPLAASILLAFVASAVIAILTYLIAIRPVVRRLASTSNTRRTLCAPLMEETRIVHFLAGQKNRPLG